MRHCHRHVACQVSFFLRISNKSSCLKVENYSYMPECILYCLNTCGKWRAYRFFQACEDILRTEQNYSCALREI